MLTEDYVIWQEADIHFRGQEGNGPYPTALSYKPYFKPEILICRFVQEIGTLVCRATVKELFQGCI